jgi:hypothetical protein
VRRKTMLQPDELKSLARPELEALCAERGEEIERLRVDGERLRWFFGDANKTAWLPEYMRGVQEHWSYEQWMASIDAARKGEPHA